MKIVDKIIEPGKLVNNFEIDFISVEETSNKLPEDVIDITDINGENFNEPVSGKAYITYPLKVIVEVEIENVETIGELLLKIAQTYRIIYDEEEKSSTVDVLPEDERVPLLNRNSTDGKYGVWGHDIDDLVFESVEIYDNGVIEINIGS